MTCRVAAPTKNFLSITIGFKESMTSQVRPSSFLIFSGGQKYDLKFLWVFMVKNYIKYFEVGAVLPPFS